MKNNAKRMVKGIKIRAAAAGLIGPEVLSPCHFGKTEPARLLELLNDRPDIEVRIRKMKR